MHTAYFEDRTFFAQSFARLSEERYLNEAMVKGLPFIYRLGATFPVPLMIDNWSGAMLDECQRN